MSQINNTVISKETWSDLNNPAVITEFIKNDIINVLKTVILLGGQVDIIDEQQKKIGGFTIENDVLTANYLQVKTRPWLFFCLGAGLCLFLFAIDSIDLDFQKSMGANRLILTPLIFLYAQNQLSYSNIMTVTVLSLGLIFYKKLAVNITAPVCSYPGFR